MNIKAFHTGFKLEGKSFSSVKEILEFSKTFSFEVHFFLKDWFNNKSYVEVKTSGSTGKPKVIQLQKKQMVNSALATGTFFNLKENTSALLCMSAEYIAGKMMLVRALVLGWDIDVVEPNSNPLKDCEKQYDFCAMVPLQLNNSLAEIQKVKKLIVGGGVVSNELLNKIQTIKTEIFATYGMTETMTHIAVKKLNNFNEITERSRSNNTINDNVISTSLNYQHHSKLVSKSHFKTISNVKISQDNRNCLVISAPNIADEDIVTNDIVKIISDSEFDWLGRYDNVINSGGIKLIPEQIEEKLSQIIEQRFFVAGISDAVLGEKLVLIVEDLVTKRSRSDDNISNNVISTSLNYQNNLMLKIKQLSKLSKYEIPKKIYFVEEFIETKTNKIDRIKTFLKFIPN